MKKYTFASVLLTFTALGMSACSLAPDYDRPNVSVPKQWNNTLDKTPTEQFWDGFHDAQLKSMVQQSGRSSHS